MTEQKLSLLKRVEQKLAQSAPIPSAPTPRHPEGTFPTPGFDRDFYDAIFRRTTEKPVVDKAQQEMINNLRKTFYDEHQIQVNNGDITDPVALANFHLRYDDMLARFKAKPEKVDPISHKLYQKPNQD